MRPLNAYIYNEVYTNALGYFSSLVTGQCVGLGFVIIVVFII